MYGGSSFLIPDPVNISLSTHSIEVDGEYIRIWDLLGYGGRIVGPQAKSENDFGIFF